MLTQEHRNNVENRITELVKMASEKFNRFNKEFKRPLIFFDVKGARGGFYRNGEIHLNPVLLVENGDEYIHQTVGHEFAHYVQRQIFPYSKPHGVEWKFCMRELGLEPVRCHSYDISNTTSRKRHIVVCNCQEHKVTMRIINKLRSGIRYRCRICSGNLVEKNS